MSRQEIDIELIAKYYNGELDGKAMQQLEERALDDPFLAEAMDGFAELGLRKNDLVDLNERLKDRIRNRSEKGTKSFGFRNWTIAASIVVLIGLISIYTNLPEEAKAPVTVANRTENKNLEDLERQAENDASTDTVVGKQDIIDQSPVIVSLENKTAKEREEIISSDQIILQSVGSAPVMDSLKNEMVITSENLLAARSAKSMVTRSANLHRIVKGKVTDAESKSAISGVSVIDTETGITTVTDMNGEFKLPTESEAKLSVRSLGYQKKEMAVVEGDSVHIPLQPDMASLSEVVVVGKGSGSRYRGGPKEGWAAFKKYLNDNDELETDEIGTVVVEFVIHANASLSDFKILRSLSKLADARAISLIRNYSSWEGSSDGTANKVRVTLRFK